MWHKITTCGFTACLGMVLSVTALAGSEVESARSDQSTVPQMGLYAGLMVGGYYRNMQDNLALAGAVKQGSSQATSWNWGRGAFDAGADVGYQFTDVLSIELGTFYLQPQKFKFNSGGGSAATGSYCNSVYCYAAGSYTQLSTWATYVGVKAEASIWQALSIYTKLAAAYVDTRYRIHLSSGSQLVGGGSAADDAVADSTYWAPVIAVGAEYRLSDRWRASVQYMLILGGDTLYNDPAVVQGRITTINEIVQPAIQLFTVGMEYQFSA
jgi:hypothetical protein